MKIAGGEVAEAEVPAAIITLAGVGVVGPEEAAELDAVPAPGPRHGFGEGVAAVGVGGEVGPAEAVRGGSSAAEVDYRKCPLVPTDALDAELLVPTLKLRHLGGLVVVAIQADGEVAEDVRSRDPVVVDAADTGVDKLRR